MSASELISKQIQDYENCRLSYEAFSLKLKELLRLIVEANDLKIHSIEARTKTVDSFHEKITRLGKTYHDPLKEVPDLCGCRIITYYSDEVSMIAEILKNEFLIVEEELTHQASELDADRFGYLSAHYVVKLNGQRSKLLEWRAFESMHAEIQIRTIIQHAWSAISHFIQYKNEIAIPSQLQRRLFRIAGLFELADEEFIGIRNQKLSLQESAAKAIAAGKKDIPLSTSSISEAVKAWTRRDAARKAAAEAGFLLGDEVNMIGPNYIGDIYNLAAKIDIDSIDKLLDTVNSVDMRFLNNIFTKNLEKKMSGGASWTINDTFIFYLFLITAAKDHIDVDYLVDAEFSRSIAEIIMEALQGGAKPRPPGRRLNQTRK